MRETLALMRVNLLGMLTSFSNNKQGKKKASGALIVLLMGGLSFCRVSEGCAAADAGADSGSSGSFAGSGGTFFPVSHDGARLCIHQPGREISLDSEGGADPQQYAVSCESSSQRIADLGTGTFVPAPALSLIHI